MVKKETALRDELDAEEIELLEAAEKNELIALHESLDKYVQVAKNTVATNKRISITI